jgi:hypothetical protein
MSVLIKKDDDEDDYMSSSILLQIKDVRPGVASAQERRRIEIYERTKEANERNRKAQDKTSIEIEKREEGLETPIGQDTKGTPQHAHPVPH